MATRSAAKSRWERKGSKHKSAAPKPMAQGSKRPGKKSQYAQQLAEKQKAKRTYGLRERQFKLFFDRAGRKGDAGENLMIMLETRFDNVIYRLGIAASRAQARQMVSHGMFTINGKLVDIPSYLVKAGDMIAIKKNKLQKKVIFEPEMMTSRELALHLIGNYTFLEAGLGDENWHPDTFKILGDFATTEALLAKFDGVYSALSQKAGSLKEDTLERRVKPFGAEQKVSSVIQSIAEHEIHHRGQLYVYLRLMGLKPPAMYGE